MVTLKPRTTNGTAAWGSGGGNGDEDEELSRAIAASLAQEGGVHRILHFSPRFPTTMTHCRAVHFRWNAGACMGHLKLFQVSCCAICTLKHCLCDQAMCVLLCRPGRSEGA